MRGLLGLPLAMTLFLAMAGPALASDAMLPLLLHPAQPASSNPVAPAPAAAPAGSQISLVTTSPLAIFAALLGALVVTALTFVMLARADRRTAARRAR